MRFAHHRSALLLMLLALTLIVPSASTTRATSSGTTPLASATKQVFLPLVGTPAPLPSSQVLIAQALAAKKIDYPTSLLYRAFALFGDARLPPAFHGSGPQGEDSSFYDEARQPNLPANIQAELRPFLLRPDNPDSLFSQKGRAEAKPRLQAASDFYCDANNWTALASGDIGIEIKIHVMCTGDFETDLRDARTLMDELWGPMTKLMGEPIRDTGGKDGGFSDDIDIYLMDPLGKVNRNGYDQQIPKYAIAVAPTAAPYTNGTASGYILIGRGLLSNAPHFKSTLAHEFFHVLQHAHNSSIGFRDRKEWWFMEASAAWAETHFVREASHEMVHPRFLYNFADVDLPLHMPGEANNPATEHEFQHIYAAYIWPFFMEQERGAQAVAQAWKGIKGIGNDWDKGMAAIDAQLPFDTHFRRFAMRNMNMELLPGNPIQPRYKNLDSKFPDNIPPRMATTMYLSASAPDEESATLESELPALRAHYFQLIVPEDAHKLELDFSNIADVDALDVDVLVKIRNQGWQHHALNDVNKTSWCEVEHAYVVLSNHDLDVTKKTPTSFNAKALEKCDSGRVTGTVTWTETGSSELPSGAKSRIQRNLTVNVRVRYDAEQERYVDDGSTFSYTGSSYNEGRNATTGELGFIIETTQNGSGPISDKGHIQVDMSADGKQLFLSDAVEYDQTTTSTYYPSGTTFTSTNTDGWTPSCGGANSGVYAKLPEGSTGNTYAISCTNTIENSSMKNTLTVSGSLMVE